MFISRGLHLFIEHLDLRRRAQLPIVYFPRAWQSSKTVRWRPRLLNADLLQIRVETLVPLALLCLAITNLQRAGYAIARLIYCALTEFIDFNGDTSVICVGCRLFLRGSTLNVDQHRPTVSLVYLRLVLSVGVEPGLGQLRLDL